MVWKLLLIFLVSMVPLIELRGTIPVAIGLELGVPEWLVLVTAILGNLMPVPLVYWFARRVLEWGAGLDEGAKGRGDGAGAKAGSGGIGVKVVEDGSDGIGVKVVKDGSGGVGVKAVKAGAKGKTRRELARFCRFCLGKGEKLGRKLTAKTGNSVYVALFLFVAVPVPGAGAWTGTLAASLLGLDFRKTVVAVMGGVLVAGVVMLLASLGVWEVLR